MLALLWDVSIDGVGQYVGESLSGDIGIDGVKNRVPVELGEKLSDFLVISLAEVVRYGSRCSVKVAFRFGVYSHE